MSTSTPNFGLVEPAKSELYNVQVFNGNMEIIDTEMHKPPLTVNDLSPDEDRNIYIEEVPLANNLASDIAQLNNSEFVERTSGGESSIEDGSASLISIKGNMIRTGYVAESIEHTESDGLSVSIDHDTFVGYVNSSGTYTFTYSTEWTPALTSYGITVTGTPTADDTITVVYVKEDRGTIATATPTSFNSTGWNLYNSVSGYAKVVAYSTQYGYRIGGTYSLVQFATTISGEKSAVAVSSGLFNVAEDGYIFVTGGDSTTYIYPTWSDWTDEYEGNFQSYMLDTIDLSEIMVSFPNGLCAVGETRDEINLNVQRAVQRVERLSYTAENLASVIASGVAYTYDTNYIYAVLETPVSISIDTDGTYNVSDHGIEFFTNTTVPVYTEILYGENLKDKLRTDVLTISEQTLTAAQKAQVQANLGLVIANNLTTTTEGKVLDARQGKALNDAFITSSIVSSPVSWTTAAGSSNDRGCTLTKWGQVRQINMYFTPSSAGSGWTTIATLTSGNRPKDSDCRVLLLNTTDSIVKTAKITSSGNIQILSPEASKAYRIIDTFIV